MSPAPFVLTTAERVAIEEIAEEHPELMADLRGWFALVLDDLGLTSQGRVVTDGEVDNLLGRLHPEAVRRMMAEMEPWGEDEDLREPVVDLLTRQLLTEARDGFVRRLLAPKRN